MRATFEHERGGDRDADLDGDDQVDVMVAAAVRIGTIASDRSRSARLDVVGLDHAHGGDHEHPGEGGERDLGDETAEEQHDQKEHDGVDDGGGRVRPADVHGGASDRAGGGHPAEQR